MKVTYWMRETNIFDDTSDFFDNDKVAFSFIEVDKVYTTTGTRAGSLHCTKIQIEDGLCEPYLQLVVRAGNTQSVVERGYYTIAILIAEVGGFGDIVMLILIFTVEVYNGKKQADFVRKQLYGDIIEALKGKKEHDDPSKMSKNDNIGKGGILAKDEFGGVRGGSGIQKNGIQSDEGLEDEFDLFDLCKACQRSDIVSSLF